MLQKVKIGMKQSNIGKILISDKGAIYDKTLIINASEIEPQVTWGTSPEDVVTINSKIPDPKILKIKKRKICKRGH